jgi:hypothetical protein
VPTGITVLPFTTTGSASVAENDWPEVLSFDPSASPSLTVSVVPAGNTAADTEVAGFSPAFAGVFESVAVPTAESAAEADPGVEFAGVSAGLFEQAEIANIRRTKSR